MFRARLKQLCQNVNSQLNWFRIHLLAFTFVPFLFSGFFVAANPSSTSGQYVTGYLDALFMCYSAMTVCGLNVVSVSVLQPAQQAFLFILMIFGDTSIVSLLTLLARQIWFRSKGRRIVKSTMLRDMYRHQRSTRSIGRGGEPGIRADNDASSQTTGGDSYGRTAEQGSDDRDSRRSDVSEVSERSERTERRASQDTERAHLIPSEDNNPWSEGHSRRTTMRKRNERPPSQTNQTSQREKPKDPHGHVPHATSGRAAHSGRGGFPSLWSALYWLLYFAAPNLTTRLSRRLRHSDVGEAAHNALAHPMKDFEHAIEERRDRKEKQDAAQVKWLPPGIRNVVVGRNSQFFEEELNDEELELLGVLEYKATKILTIVLVIHQLFWVLVPTAIVSIYFASVTRWNGVFLGNGPTQSAGVDKTWYAFFQVTSAYSSCGLSLVGGSMVPFQECYLLIYVLLFPMVAGNQLLPLFLRAEIWLFSKTVRRGSELEVTLHFLMTHSRRLFLYMFPTYQSWWLFSIEFFLWLTGTLGFIAYNHGLPYYNSLGTGWDKFSIGQFEAEASRASGFGIISLGDLAPAMNFLYIILIFTCNYPLAMALRSTNVFEERALGIHGGHAPHEANEAKDDHGALFSKYLKNHLLPQIYFDLWPIALGTMLILVVERGNLMSNEHTWITDFRVLFEATSAYGIVGLSYGNPYNSSSLSGVFRKLSKLIIIVLMLRGRHRGLPLAIERATMFPVEYLRFSPGKRSRVEEDRVEEAGREAEDE